MKNIKSTILHILPYALIALFAISLSVQKGSIPYFMAKNIDIITYVFFFISFAVAIKFKRSRAFFILLISLISFALFIENGLIEKEIKFFGGYSKTFISVALPINIALFVFFKERGFFTIKGMARTLFIAAQFLSLFFIAYNKNTLFFDILYADFIPPRLTESVALSDASLIVAILSLIVIIAKLLRQKNHLDIGFLIALPLLLTAVNFSDNKEIMSLFFISSSLTIAFSILSESYHLAYFDELTNIPARRALLEHFAKLGRKYTIAMVDIDHFKKFNDTHGHDVGDDVLKLVASGLSKTTGGADVYRYGGEEFTIVFPGKSAEEAFIHLDSIREEISKTPYTLKQKNRKREKTLFVTVSIGMAQKTPNEKSPQEVMKQADNALYKAKNAGRNRVC